MRIHKMQSIATEIPYLNAGRGPGDFYEDRLPILEATVDRLPEGLDAIIATGDLQGRERHEDAAGNPLRLLGEVVPQRLARDVLPAIGLTETDAIGVILAGDFYTVPTLDRRGGSGDVTPVWEAFENAFGWVCGVAGNHDLFGTTSDAPQFGGRAHFLDGNRIEISGLEIGGVSGIIGRPTKPWRRTEQEFVRVLDSMVTRRADVVVMHDGPNIPGTKLVGSDCIRDAVERLGPALVIRGHAYWPSPLAELPGRVQVLNVDSRVVVIRPAHGS